MLVAKNRNVFCLSLILIVLAVAFVSVSLAAEGSNTKWKNDKYRFLMASRSEHDKHIENWEEVAFWSFDDHQMPEQFRVLGGAWKVENGQLAAYAKDAQGSTIIELAKCEWPVFKLEFEATLQSEYPDTPDRICDIIVGLNCDPQSGSFAKGYALLLAHYYNQATTCYRLNVPCARIESSPIVPGKKHHIRIEVVKPHIRTWVDGRVALDYWERAGRKNRDYSDFLDMDPARTITLRTYDSTLIIDNLKISTPAQNVE